MERIPVLLIGKTLLVTMQSDLHDKVALALQEELAERIIKTEAKGVVIDISALEIVDSFIGRLLANTAEISSLLGARTVVVGMQPAIAITLVELGLGLQGIQTALDVDRGIALLAKGNEQGWGHGRSKLDDLDAIRRFK